MSAPVQVSGLTMGAAAATFAGAGSKTSVELVVDIAGSALTAASDPRGKGSFDLLMTVTDANGNIKANERGSVAMNLSAATRDAVAQHGLRVLSRLDVPPGQYLLRIAGVDSGGTAQGSLQYDLEVPDFTQGSLAMSGLALSAASDLQRPIAGSDKAWNERFMQPPTAARAFSADDNLFVSGEIYRNDPRVTDVDVFTIVRNASGEIVFERDQTLDEPGSSSSRLQHQTKIPLEGLDPGNYLVVVEASSSSDIKTTVSQQVSFEVR